MQLVVNCGSLKEGKNAYRPVLIAIEDGREILFHANGTFLTAENVTKMWNRILLCIREGSTVSASKPKCAKRPAQKKSRKRRAKSKG